MFALWHLACTGASWSDEVGTTPTGGTASTSCGTTGADASLPALDVRATRHPDTGTLADLDVAVDRAGELWVIYGPVDDPERYQRAWDLEEPGTWTVRLAGLPAGTPAVARVELRVDGCAVAASEVELEAIAPLEGIRVTTEIGTGSPGEAYVLFPVRVGNQHLGLALDRDGVPVGWWPTEGYRVRLGADGVVESLLQGDADDGLGAIVRVDQASGEELERVAIPGYPHHDFTGDLVLGYDLASDPDWAWDRIQWWDGAVLLDTRTTLGSLVLESTSGCTDQIGTGRPSCAYLNGLSVSPDGVACATGAGTVPLVLCQGADGVPDLLAGALAWSPAPDGVRGWAPEGGDGPMLPHGAVDLTAWADRLSWVALDPGDRLWMVFDRRDEVSCSTVDLYRLSGGIAAHLEAWSDADCVSTGQGGNVDPLLLGDDLFVAVSYSDAGVLKLLRAGAGGWEVAWTVRVEGADTRGFVTLLDHVPVPEPWRD